MSQWLLYITTQKRRKRRNEMPTDKIWIAYGYWRPFNPVPFIKWRKFWSKEKARKFINKINLAKRKYIWDILVNEMSVEEL